jgi:hypothetical protein
MSAPMADRATDRQSITTSYDDAQQIRADDRLIEHVRTGWITASHPDPLARLLARWRESVLAK